ncbi:hypothetical protein [Serinicoccus sp. LYQ131]|uniref:hypothetical protein n=1 Tax=Serinicoccus sp. LYQ131 TaxID=3378797 RepID=UPI0038548405
MVAGADGQVDDVNAAAALSSLQAAAKKQRVVRFLVLPVAAGLWSAFMGLVNPWTSSGDALLGAAIFVVVVGPAWWFLMTPVWVRRPPAALSPGVVVSVKLGVLHVRVDDDVVVIGRRGVTSGLVVGDRVLTTPVHLRCAAVVVMDETRGPTVVPATATQL